jgi:hypothetical protein
MASLAPVPEQFKRKTGTNPTKALSYFDFDPSGTKPVANGVQLRWNSLADRTYRVEPSANLPDTPTFTVLQSGIQGARAARIHRHRRNRPRTILPRLRRVALPPAVFERELPPPFHFHLAIFAAGFYLVYFQPLERISRESYTLLPSAFPHQL